MRAWKGVQGRRLFTSFLSVTHVLLSWAPLAGSASTSSVRLGLPISIRYIQGAEGNGPDAEITMCHAIKYEAYQRAPQDFACYDDLVKRYCGASTTTTALLSQVVQGREDGSVPSAAPVGFVFQPPLASSVEGRLLTGVLAASPANRVVAMPQVLTQAAHDCHGCSEADVAKVLKDLIWLMGAAPSSPHKAADRSVPLLWLTLPWDLQDAVLRAFPSTPWLFTFSEPLWSLQHGSCLSMSSGGSEEECARELQMAYLSTLAAMRKSPGRAIELSASLGTDASASAELVEGLIELLVPGHFHVALSDKEKAHMRSAATRIIGTGYEPSEPGRTSDQLGSIASKARLPQLYADLQEAQASDRDRLQHVAWEKRQEAYIYSKTGARFYDTVKCPDVPQRPKMYNVMGMIANWHPDNSSVPPRYYDSVCRFDYMTEWHKAMAYRDAEVPFVLYNIPSLDEATQKWSTPGYLNKAFGSTKLHVEVCKTSHFQYYYEEKAKALSPEEYQRPSMPSTITFDEWHDWAMTHKDHLTPSDEHIYMRDSDAPLFVRDLPILTAKGDVFEFSDDQWEISCRFGIQGTIIDTHFDNRRNIAAQIVGSRRWLLNPPEECHNSYLLGIRHPSYRHSSFDWAQPVDLEKYPLFAKAVGTEVVMTEGDLLYVPAFWQHTITTLQGLSYHCNSLGGHTPVGLDVSRDCGFYDDEQMITVWEEEAWKAVYRRARQRELKQRHMQRLRKKARGRVVLGGKK